MRCVEDERASTPRARGRRDGVYITFRANGRPGDESEDHLMLALQWARYQFVIVACGLGGPAPTTHDHPRGVN